MASAAVATEAKAEVIPVGSEELTIEGGVPPVPKVERERTIAEILADKSLSYFKRLLQLICHNMELKKAEIKDEAMVVGYIMEHLKRQQPGVIINALEDCGENTKELLQTNTIVQLNKMLTKYIVDQSVKTGASAVINGFFAPKEKPVASAEPKSESPKTDERASPSKKSWADQAEEFDEEERASQKDEEEEQKERAALIGKLTAANRVGAATLSTTALRDRVASQVAPKKKAAKKDTEDWSVAKSHVKEKKYMYSPEMCRKVLTSDNTKNAGRGRYTSACWVIPMADNLSPILPPEFDWFLWDLDEVGHPIGWFPTDSEGNVVNQEDIEDVKKHEYWKVTDQSQWFHQFLPREKHAEFGKIRHFEIVDVYDRSLGEDADPVERRVIERDVHQAIRAYTPWRLLHANDKRGTYYRKRY